MNQDNFQGPSNCESFKIATLSEPLGAQVRDLDLRVASADTVTSVAKHLAHHGVLFLRDCHWSISELRSVGRQFGELHVHPYYKPISDQYPEVLELDSDNYGKEPVCWHTDVTFATIPPAVTILQCVQPPRNGGETCWVSTSKAFERLPRVTRMLFAKLRVIHESSQVFANRNPEPKVFSSSPMTESAIHPLVVTHPLTGRRALYLNPNYASGIRYFPPAIGRALLSWLTDFATRDQFVLRWNWSEPGMIAIWDNRVTLHSVAGWFEGRRVMRRVCAIGPVTREDCCPTSSA